MTAKLRSLVSWLLAPARRRWTLAATACAAVLVLVAAVVLWPRGEDELTDRVANAVARPDPVPDGPIVTSIPPACGLSVKTIDQLVGLAPGRESSDSPDEQACSWNTGSLSFAGGGVELDIEVAKAHERTLPAERLPNTVTAYLDAVKYAQDSSSAMSIDEVHPVEGLGAEAITWRESRSGSAFTESHVHVLFWQGNVLVKVSYGGRAEFAVEVARERAFKAATEVASSMKLAASGKPKPSEASDRSVAAVPTACGLLPASVAQQFGETAEGDTEKSYLFGEDAHADGGACEWGYELAAEIGTVPDTSFGTGEQAAARKYLELYLAARNEGPEADTEDAEVYTVPLRGIGDEAFAQYQRDTSSTGEVVFRVGDTLVRVSVRSLHDEDLNRRDALDGAYQVAVAAAKNVKVE